MKAKKTIRGIALTIVFVLLLHLSARYWGLVLFPKMSLREDSDGTWSQDYSTYYFGLTRPNTVDEVFIGSSHQFCSIDVNILNRDYGMNSILLTSSGQNLTFSYYAVKEALELQNPKTVILEASGAIADIREISELSSEYFLDNMPNWTRTKFECVMSLGYAPYYHYYPITVLHSGWTNIKLADLRLPPRLENGERYTYRYPFVVPLDIPEPIPMDKKAPLSEYAYSELSRIAALCRENNVKLILYTAPYLASEGEQQRLNAVADFAEANGIEYINMLYETAQAGINGETDYLDAEHLNLSGQEKLTRYMAEQGYFV